MEIALPAAIGSEVLLGTDALLGQIGLVIAWRVTRPPLLVGGVLDQPPQVAVLVITRQGHALWVAAAAVAGTSTLATFFLPFTAGDLVKVRSSQARGEVRSWEVTGRRLRTEVHYRVHLVGTPTGEELTVAVSDLVPWAVCVVTPPTASDGRRREPVD